MDYCSMARASVRAAMAVSRQYYHGLSRSLFKGRGLEYVDFREYQPGDEPGRVDWRLTARSPGERGYRLLVREYEEEHIKRITLAVGLYDSIFYKRKPYMLAYVATLIARAAERLGDELNLVILAGDRPRRVPVRAATAPQAVSREICRGPQGGDPDKLLGGLPRLAGGTPLALVLDYNVDPGVLGQVLRGASLAPGKAMVAIVYAREEVAPPPVDGLATITPGGGAGGYGRIRDFYGRVRLHAARLEASARRGILVKASTPSPALVRRIIWSYTRLRA